MRLFSSKVVQERGRRDGIVRVSVWTAISGVAGIALFGIACIGDMVGLRKLISFLGGLACAAAWIIGAGLRIDALIGFALVAESSADVTSGDGSHHGSAVPRLRLALPNVSSASRIAFNARR